MHSQYLLADLARWLPDRASRRFHAYGVGTPRSGTLSVASMFASHYASEQEPDWRVTIVHLLQWLNGRYTDQEMHALLIARDKHLQLEMESSHFLHHVAQMLVQLFPSAKFVLTLREPLSWLNSEINQNIGTQRLPVWRALEEFRYGRYNHDFKKEERVLQDPDNVYPVASYLSYWSDHNRRILDAVPEDRLLIVKTRAITDSIPEIARFVGIDPGSIDRARTHAGARSEASFDLSTSVDRDFIMESIETYCGDLVKRLFPEMV